jgi:phage-related baseplate assembly protein
MQVLQSIDTEKIIFDRMQQFKALWAKYDPPNAAQYDVDLLEFDPIKIQAELEAFFELLVRDRVNQAARAVTMAFAVGSDLDAIASRYPYGVPRLQYDAKGNVLTQAQITAGALVASTEKDAAYRTRLWNSPSILSLNGPGQATYESYVFWALSTPMPAGENPLKHAAALTTPGTGRVFVPIVQDNYTPVSSIEPATGDYVTVDSGTPVPTSKQISAVYDFIHAPDQARMGLTDWLNVVAPRLVTTAINVQIKLFPGVDVATMMQEVQAAVLALIDAVRWLGADLTMLALNGALAQAGVYNVNILSPTQDVVVSQSGVIKVLSVRLHFAGFGE